MSLSLNNITATNLVPDAADLHQLEQDLLRLERQVVNLEQRAGPVVSQHEQELEAEVALLKMQLTTQQQAANERIGQALNQQQVRHEATIASLRSELTNRSAQVAPSYTTAMLQTQIAVLESKHKKELEDLRASYDQHILGLEHQLQAAGSAKDRFRQEDDTATRRTQQAEQETNRQHIHRLESQLQAAISARDLIRQQHDAVVRRTQQVEQEIDRVQRSEAEIKLLLTKVKHEADKLLIKYDQLLAERRGSYGDPLRPQLALAQARVQGLERELQAGYTSLRSQVAESNQLAEERDQLVSSLTIMRDYEGVVREQLSQLRSSNERLHNELVQASHECNARQRQTASLREERDAALQLAASNDHQQQQLEVELLSLYDQQAVLQNRVVVLEAVQSEVTEVWAELYTVSNREAAFAQEMAELRGQLAEARISIVLAQVAEANVVATIQQLDEDKEQLSQMCNDLTGQLEQMQAQLAAETMAQVELRSEQPSAPIQVTDEVAILHPHHYLVESDVSSATALPNVASAKRPLAGSTIETYKTPLSSSPTSHPLKLISIGELLDQIAEIEQSDLRHHRHPILNLSARSHRLSR